MHGMLPSFSSSSSSSPAVEIIYRDRQLPPLRDRQHRLSPPRAAAGGGLRELSPAFFQDSSLLDPQAMGAFQVGR